MFKDKLKKLHPQKKNDPGSALSSVKSSSKTNAWSEEEPEVSQYLNFEEQEAL